MPGFSPIATETDSSADKRVETFLKDANDTSAHAQNAYLLFLVTGAYLAITIGSTTDEQLLRISNVTLPALNIGIPILAFYVLAPWLTVLLHFNLLLQLYILSTKLHALDTAIASIESAQQQNDHRRQLFPFPLNHLLIGHHHSRFMRFLFFLVVWITMLLLPTVLLLATQIRFLPYHDEAITGSQQAAVAVEVFLLWLLWPRIVEPRGHRAWRQQVISMPLHWSFTQKLIKVTPPGKLQNFLLRAQDWERRQDLHAVNTTGIFALTSIAPLLLFFSLCIAIVPDRHLEHWITAAFRWSTTLEHVFIKIPDPGRVSSLLTYWVFDATNLKGQSRPFFRRNLELEGKVFVLGDPPSEVKAALLSDNEKDRSKARKKVMGINLQRRNLRFSLLTESVLPKSDLQGVRLRGSLLMEAQLQGANLWGAGLRSSNMQSAQLQNAFLRSTYLEAADLYRAQLGKADLNGAKLQGASLHKADLRGADLQNADLRGANLQDADLRGADLRRAKLQGADLRKAKLQGATLENAQLQGTNLEGANIEGAIFSHTEMDLSNLVSIHRGIFDYSAFNDLENSLSQIAVNFPRNQISAEFGEEKEAHPFMIQDRRSTNDTLEEANLQNAWCDAFLPLKGCLPAPERSTYEQQLVAFLAELSCEDPYVALGVIRHRIDNNSLSLLDHNLAAALLDKAEQRGCRGVHKLPQGKKDQLKEIVKKYENKKSEPRP